jgi:hypothetical protein
MQILTCGYPYVAVFATRDGLPPSFVQATCRRAEADGAPVDAVYRRVDGSWATIADIGSPSVRRALGLPILTGQQLARVRMYAVRDIAVLVLRQHQGRPDVTPFAPAAGQPAVVDRGTVYWLLRPVVDASKDPDRRHEDEFDGWQQDAPLLCAPIDDEGFVDWDELYTVPDRYYLDECEQTELMRDVREILTTPFEDVPDEALPSAPLPVGRNANLYTWTTQTGDGRDDETYVLDANGVTVTVEPGPGGAPLVHVDSQHPDRPVRVLVDGWLVDG